MTIYIPKNLLITGGAGFIGSNFVRLMRHYNPVILDALTYAGSLENLAGLQEGKDYRFVHGNICDRDLVHATLRYYNIDTIVHFAAESHVDNSISNPSIFIQTNVIGTETFLSCAKQYWTDAFKLSPTECRFHHISTDEVFGSLMPNDIPTKEIDRYNPNSPYAASKAASDHLVRAYFKTYDLPTLITYSTNNYGPYQHKEKFIPVIINSCLEDKPIPIYGTGKNIRDWMHVQDHCNALKIALQKGQPGENYNISCHNPLSNLELVEMLCAAMNEIAPRNQPYQRLIHFVKDRAGHDFRYALDTTKIATELNWKASIIPAVGLKATVIFFCERNRIAVR